MQTSDETELADKLRRAGIDGRVLPQALADPEPVAAGPHGPFRSHLDLPMLDPGEVARMGPVWDAIYKLVAEHPTGCGCDPGVMAWRAAYATAEILLRLPDAEGVFRKRYIGDTDDGYIYGWRCSKCPTTVERVNKGWSPNSARGAYEAHMSAKHPEGAYDDRT